MPIVAEFYGIVVALYFFDTKEHKRPHLHARYGGDEAVYSLPEGDLLAGGLPRRQARLVEAWIVLREADLLAAWARASRGEAPGKILPL